MPDSPGLLLGGLLAWWWRSGGAGELAGLGGMGMGQSRARRYDPSSAKRTTFADVAGIEDVKNEVTEIVDFLRDPGRYARLGAQIPRGVPLSGQPGTGKTLLARAGVPLAPGVDLDALAAATPGMVGADLKHLVNQAALLAARRGEDRMTMADFSDSLEKIVLGTARGIVLSPGERERTAFHESGHALVGILTPGADPVRKISIIPRGQSLGVTYQALQSDRYDHSAAYLRGRITGALGGRAAEKVIYGDVTTGAENDLEHASDIARQMAGRWGMSPAIGPVSVLPASGQESGTGTDGAAPATKELIDTETRRIIEECYQQALETLRGSRDRLDRLARTLLDRETLEEDEAYAAAGIRRDTAPAAIAGGEAA